MNSQPNAHDEEHGAFSPGRIALAVFLAVARFFLPTEHRAHVYGALPYLPCSRAP